VYDLAIIGGGPAGLTAAVKAGSEGLSVVVLEASSTLGGRAYQSPLIENVPGFPAGISGPALFDGLAAQARKFGAELWTDQRVTALMRMGDKLWVATADRNLYARSVIIAVGETTPKLDALRPYEGRGVEYACDATTLHEHAGQHVMLVGGGNSCAQLALALADKGARRVTILTRSPLAETTSMYLRQRLAAERGSRHQTPWITVVQGEITTAHGDETLSRVSIAVHEGKVGLQPDHTYVFIGGVPATGWFSGAKTAEGYILTGYDVPREDWPLYHTGDDGITYLERSPYPQESSIPGVFVAGDVRAGATGGITVAFGEGTQAFQWIRREYLPGLTDTTTEKDRVEVL
jgi:thioredoxin reductase (NADPH)